MKKTYDNRSSSGRRLAFIKGTETFFGTFSVCGINGINAKTNDPTEE